MIGNIARKKIEQIINAAETGSAMGNYAHIDLYFDGKNKTQQITYGKSCTTEQGNLPILVKDYVKNNGKYALDFVPYAEKIGRESLIKNTAFIALLKKAGQDPIMQKTQDVFFEKIYFVPSANFCKGYNFTLPLSYLVVYDSYIHSGGILGFLRERFEATPDNEKLWIEQYIDTRHEWLANHSDNLLRKTIYRTQCYKNQIQVANWYLEQPVTMNGIKIK